MEDRRRPQLELPFVEKKKKKSPCLESKQPVCLSVFKVLGGPGSWTLTARGDQYTRSRSSWYILVAGICRNRSSLLVPPPRSLSEPTLDQGSVRPSKDSYRGDVHQRSCKIAPKFVARKRARCD